jgi:hypothetical protein
MDLPRLSPAERAAHAAAEQFCGAGGGSQESL